MPADWKDTVLSHGTFRGLKFHTPGIREAFGRAVAVHNYPQGQWFPEDTGEDPHTHRVTGFVIGDDYLDQRAALVKAFKAEGPGTLVHPWLGTLTVQVGKVDGSLSASHGGSWEFNAEVVEVVEERGPVVAVDGPLLIVSAVADVETSAVSDFIDAIESQGFPGFVDDARIGEFSRLQDAFTRVSARFLASLTEDVSDISDAAALVDPRAVPDSLAPLTVDFLRLVEPLPIWREFLSEISPRVPTALAAPTTPSKTQAATNVDATLRFWLQLGLAYAVRGVSLEPFESFDEALLLRDELVDQINAELELTESDAPFRALLDLRTQLAADIDRRSTELAVLRTVVLVAPKSSLELAWERYGDPIREAEIVDRNDVTHPLFMIGPIRVLSA
jgi:prophage DNA circulation protein